MTNVIGIDINTFSIVLSETAVRKLVFETVMRNFLRFSKPCEESLKFVQIKTVVSKRFTASSDIQN